MTSSKERSKTDVLPGETSIHIGEVDTLFTWTERVVSPTVLVIAPVELHRRNLKLRLTEANRPLDAFEFMGPAGVAARLLERTGHSSQSLDRVDRLSLLGGILAGAHEARDHFRMVLGSEPAQNGKAIEQARTVLETTTNYQPPRIQALRQTIETTPSPDDAVARDILAGTLAIEKALGNQTSKATSDRAILRRATRALMNNDGSMWPDAYPAVKRVAIVGLSDVPAPLVDLVNAIITTCDVKGHWFLRRGTGPFLRRRLWELLSTSEPGQAVVA